VQRLPLTTSADAILVVINICFPNHQGRVVQKPVNANPGLKVNLGNNVSFIKMLSTAYVLCGWRLLALKTERQKM